MSSFSGVYYFNKITVWMNPVPSGYSFGTSKWYLTSEKENLSSFFLYISFPVIQWSPYSVLSLLCSEWVICNTAEVTFTKPTLTLCPTPCISSSNFLSDCSLVLVTLVPWSVLIFFLYCNLRDFTAAFALLDHTFLNSEGPWQNTAIL